MAMSCADLYAGELLACASGSTLRPGGLELTERAVRFCAFRPGARLLDVGCGRGASVAWLRAQGFVAGGIDASASSLTAGGEAGLPLAQATAESLPVADAGLDGLLCECVLCLLARPGRVLREFSRVLRPGGRLVLSDLYRRAGGVSGTLPTRRQVQERLRDAGFELQLWEDHSSGLAQLAAQLLLTHGSLDEICAALPAVGWQSEQPGYYLAIAEKIGKTA